MFTRDDIPRNDRFQDSITVLVRNVEPSTKPNRDYEVTVEDAAGHSIPLVIWSAHDLSISLKEEHEYELEKVRGKTWRKDGTKHYKLNSTRNLAAVDLGRPSDDEYRIFVVGDTHVGYRHRPNSGKPSWAREVDNRETFKAALRRARKLDVDAVVHAGDVFDHSTVDSDHGTVYNEVARTVEARIPFYFVHGNHDMEPERKLLRRLVNEYSSCGRLTEDPFLLGDGSLSLFGIDHSGTSLPSIDPDQDIHELLSPTVLVMHDTPYPIVNRNKKVIHNQNGPTLEPWLRKSSLNPDLIISGHMHVGSQGRVRGHDIPVVITGPTAKISERTKDNDPSTWLLSFQGKQLKTDRQPI